MRPFPKTVVIVFCIRVSVVKMMTFVQDILFRAVIERLNCRGEIHVLQSADASHYVSQGTRCINA